MNVSYMPLYIYIFYIYNNNHFNLQKAMIIIIQALLFMFLQ